VPGGNVRLTIDRAIQFMAERVLADTVRKFSAKGGTAIVMDPTSGEIYAMASAPLIDANKFGDNVQAQRNRALTDTYEPGSTFKAITVAGALSEGLVTPSTSFLLPGQLQVGDRIIHESHPRGTQRFTVRRIVAESSNIGAVTLGIKLGKQRLMKWIRAFGFGRPTGIDFPGEVAGFVLPADQWWVSTMGNVPMGQGIAVTPLQMAQAYAAIANDGVAVKPHVTMQIGAKTFGSAGQSRIVSSKVARQMRDMLSDVVSDTMGTGTAAQIAGYTVAGKTGTAQKPLPNGQGYSSYNYVASFVGMVPADDPQLVVLVMVDEPHPIWGGVVAAPAFSDIAQFALQRLEIEP
jgi:cell division protein FtsI/penicillin-binding protein 2